MKFNPPQQFKSTFNTLAIKDGKVVMMKSNSDLVATNEIYLTEMLNILRISDKVAFSYDFIEKNSTEVKVGVRYEPREFGNTISGALTRLADDNIKMNLNLASDFETYYEAFEHLLNEFLKGKKYIDT